MNFLNTAVYRIIVPKFFRKKIVARVLRSNILAYYSSLKEPLTEEISKVCDYVRNRGIAMIPYSFRTNTSKIVSKSSMTQKLGCVIGKRLYFKKRWKGKRIRLSYNELKGNRMPHCYETAGLKLKQVMFWLMSVSAEGIFALSNVKGGLVPF